MIQQIAAGYKAIVLTVDAPVLGRRLNEYRNSFEPPRGTVFPNLSADPSFSFVDASKEGLINGTFLCTQIYPVPGEYNLKVIDCDVDWDDAILWFRQRTKLQLWLKGGK